MAHTLTLCKEIGSYYHGSTARRGGQWKIHFLCPVCERETYQLSNYLGRKTLACDGKFRKVERNYDAA